MQRQPAPTYFGRYQVLEELGSGSMGVVYLCVDPRLARPVAIKVLRESEHMTDSERLQFQARFRQEAEAAGRLNHPDIVQIYDIGPGYLVMEFLDGTSLAGLLRGRTVLTIRKICSLVLRVADAVDYAHRHGIVHRDVKPSNIMLMADGSVKVLDFGVARLDSSTLTAVGTVVGSVRYMAPEQMLGEKVDGRADVFSLAAVAYELLTTRPPFPGKSVTEIVSNVVHGTYVPPRQVDARLPEDLNRVFGKAFTVKPAERYARGMDFARDLYAAAQEALSLEVVHEGREPVTAPMPIPGMPGTTVDVPVPGPTTLVSPTAKTVRIVPEGAATSGREGVLLLESDPPGARVYVDGHPAGITPGAPVEVPFGRHTVRVEAEGREPVSVEIELDRDQPMRALGVTLPAPGGGGARSGQFVALGPGVTPPRRVGGAAPVYPPAARDRGLEGGPVIDLWIDHTGNVIDVAIVESAGAILDGAVLEAVAGWRFAPATLGGAPVSMRLTLQHLFRR
jgi:TonB family protein